METKKENTGAIFNLTSKQICDAYDKLFNKKKLERLEKANGN